LGINIPEYQQIPLEYRVALDASSVWLANSSPIKLHCGQPALLQEVDQRLTITDASTWSDGLWIEPQAATWENVLNELTQQLSSGSRLAVLLSLPLARRLPERRDWSGNALGEYPRGLSTFTHALHKHEFLVNIIQGLHTGQAILFNFISSSSRKIGQYALADRIEFFARQHYIKPLPTAWGATCALLLATRL
jgi:hypothetical protein